MQVPVSASAGPLHRRGPVWSCYAHTPMGAVMAAHVIYAELATRNWRIVADRAVVRDAARARFLRLSAHQTYTPMSPDQVPKPVGWHVAHYDPQNATVQALSTTDSTSWQVSTIKLAWTGGDWKLAMTDAGAPATDPVPLTSATAFTRWPARG